MSIASALFSESQSLVLRWLFVQPERRFHLSELRRLTGLASASLQRELNRLVGAGLIESERVGNLRVFQANPDSPVYAELISLVRKTLGVEALLRDVLQPLATKLKVALIYGSVARHTDTASSDVDLMLVGEQLRLGEVLDLLVPVEAQIGRKINPTCYSAKEFSKRRAELDSFVNRVLVQPVVFLIGGPDELAAAG